MLIRLAIDNPPDPTLCGQALR